MTVSQPTKVPTIGSANLPKIPPPPGASMPVTEAVLPDDQIEARPLMAPDFINYKPRNPNHSLRWVNFSVGEKASSLRYEQAQAQGFQNAALTDVSLATPVAPSYVRDGGSKIINGDLILMKIGRAAYKGALKYKDQQAVKLASKTETKKESLNRVQHDIAATGAPKELLSQVRPFVPSDAEVDGLVGKD